MLPLPTDVARRLRLPGYVILSLIVITPLVELVTASWPLRMGVPAWRFAMLGAASGTLSAAVLGLFFILCLAALAGDRPAAIAVAVVAVLATLCSLVGAGAFVLDALQMRPQVRPDGIARFRIATGWAVGKLMLLSLSSGVLALGAFRIVRSTRGPGRAAQRASTLVVGRPKQDATPRSGLRTPSAALPVQEA